MSKDLIRLERPDLLAIVELEDEWIERRDKILTETGAKFDGMVSMETQEEYDDAEVFLNRITKISGSAEKKRKEFTKPYNDFKTQIKAMCDDARSLLEFHKKNLKELMAGFVVKKAKEAEEELERKATLLAKSSFGKVQEDISVPSGQVHRSMSNIIKRWKFEIEDESQIPREYLVPDEVKIRAYVQANKGMASIAGVRIFEDLDVRSR